MDIFKNTFSIFSKAYFARVKIHSCAISSLQLFSDISSNAEASHAVTRVSIHILFPLPVLRTKSKNPFFKSASPILWPEKCEDVADENRIPQSTVRNHQAKPAELKEHTSLFVAQKVAQTSFLYQQEYPDNLRGRLKNRVLQLLNP